MEGGVFGIGPRHQDVGLQGQDYRERRRFVQDRQFIPERCRACIVKNNRQEIRQHRIRFGKGRKDQGQGRDVRKHNEEFQGDGIPERETGKGGKRVRKGTRMALPSA